VNLYNKNNGKNFTENDSFEMRKIIDKDISYRVGFQEPTHINGVEIALSTLDR
jgi:hypothetical protein